MATARIEYVRIGLTSASVALRVNTTSPKIIFNSKYFYSFYTWKDFVRFPLLHLQIHHLTLRMVSETGLFSPPTPTIEIQF